MSTGENLYNWTFNLNSCLRVLVEIKLCGIFLNLSSKLPFDTCTFTDFVICFCLLEWMYFAAYHCYDSFISKCLPQKKSNTFVIFNACIYHLIRNPISWIKKISRLKSNCSYSLILIFNEKILMHFFHYVCNLFYVCATKLPNMDAIIFLKFLRKGKSVMLQVHLINFLILLNIWICMINNIKTHLINYS